MIRGQTENALKGKCTGGTGTIGYKIDDDKFYHLDPPTAPLVLEAFQRYDNGDKMVEIVNFLNDKRRKGCNKKTVQKDWLEELVVRETMKLIQDDAVIDKIVQLVMEVQNQENTTIPLLEKQLREVDKKLDNLMKAIEDGLYTRTTKERLEALEIQKARYFAEKTAESAD